MLRCMQNKFFALKATKNIIQMMSVQEGDELNNIRHHSVLSEETRLRDVLSFANEPEKVSSMKKVTVDGVSYLEKKEGKAKILFKEAKGVFYNPTQCFNRDISIAVIRQYARVLRQEIDCSERRLRVLEALAASGLRSVRYASELAPFVERVVANDLSKMAVESIELNAKWNKMDDVIRVTHGDANLVLHQEAARRRGYLSRDTQTDGPFDVIDLDPYGCAAPFLDAGCQALVDGGLLAVTATDVAILCGNASETCRAKYGAVSAKVKCCHEMALRILLQCIETHCNRYGRYMEPVLSLSVDFYVRVFVRVYTSPQKVKRSTSNLGMVYFCTGCEAYSVQALGTVQDREKGGPLYRPAHGPPVDQHCTHCGGRHTFAGPIWLGPLHNTSFVTNLDVNIDKDQSSGETEYGTEKRMRGILSVVLEELPDVALHYTLDRLCHALRCEAIPMLKLRSALLNLGYRVSFSHTNKASVKTDAPAQVVWSVMTAWYRHHCVEKKSKENPVGDALQRKYDQLPVSRNTGTALTVEALFAPHPAANPTSRANQMLRFQVNPERFWGPGTRAAVAGQVENAKKKANQGKRGLEGEKEVNQAKKMAATDEAVINS